MRKKAKFLIMTAILLCPLWAMSGAGAQSALLQPANLTYLGAFRLPQVASFPDFTYCGNALAYYPGGDPGGEGDGFPGSLYLTGNETDLRVAEISIPAPVVSAGHNPDELNTATLLQPLTDVFAGMYEYFEQPRAGLCYLPAQSGQSSGKIHFTLGMHLQDTGFEPSNGWFELNLSNPRTAGPWVMGGYTGYVTNDYLFDIPTDWADAYTPGQYLATGRCREGPWAGGGPGLFAYGPWLDGNPPAAGSTLTSLTPLLLYGTQPPGSPEISFDSSQQVDQYQDSDRWRGAAWLTAGGASAVIFCGTKALGESWYGFADGTEWPYDCADEDTPPCPEYPPFPYDNRGFWATDFQAQLMFLSPNDLAAVATGGAETWSPQPYAFMDLSPYLFDPDYTEEDLMRYKRDFVGAITFDRDHGLLYLMEIVAEEDGRSLIHVFRVG